MQKQHLYYGRSIEFTANVKKHVWLQAKQKSCQSHGCVRLQATVTLPPLHQTRHYSIQSFFASNHCGPVGFEEVQQRSKITSGVEEVQ